MNCWAGSDWPLCRGERSFRWARRKAWFQSYRTTIRQGDVRDLANMADPSQNLFRLAFLEAHTNAIFRGGVGRPSRFRPTSESWEQLAVRDGDQLRVVTGLSSQVGRRIRGLIRVRDAVRRCLRTQLDGTPDADVLVARDALNHAYDGFVARLGPISDRPNVLAFRGDPDLPLLLSLEHYDPESDHPDSKVNQAVAAIERIWRATAAERSAQLVFCDLSIPTAGHGLSVYEDMRDKLLALGVPAMERACGCWIEGFPPKPN